jgi:predicted nucleic acid-binding protein
MDGILVDSCVILDIFENDPVWADWSETMLNNYSRHSYLYINPVIYSEVSIGFNLIEDLEKSINNCGFKILQIPKEALFLAGKAFFVYKRQKGNKTSPLPDFFIGAHAAIGNFSLLTRDTPRIKSYFPTVKLISPN